MSSTFFFDFPFLDFHTLPNKHIKKTNKNNKRKKKKRKCCINLDLSIETNAKIKILEEKEMKPKNSIFDRTIFENTLQMIFIVFESTL